MGLGNLIQDMFDSSISAELPALEVEFPHILKAYFASVKFVPLTRPISSTYTVSRGDSLSRIASREGTSIERLKSDNHLTGNMIHPNQVLVVVKDELIGENIEINPSGTASIGSKIHVVVETENFQGKALKLNIKQGVEKIIADVDQIVAVQVGEAHRGSIEIETGNFAAGTEAQNKADFADFAILELIIKPNDAESAKQWNKAIAESTDKNAKLYLLVDAHSGNTDIPEHLFSYYGKNIGTQSIPNRWLDLDGLWFELTEAKVPWVETLQGEVGVTETRGARANPRILEYFEASGYWGTDDSGEENAWCGSFAAWVMTQHGYQPPRAAYRAKSWINFGKQIGAPVYGAIGVKSREGGGHVSFIVGKSEDGNTYYMLGGNQGDKIQVRRYPKDVWTHFMIPTDYDENAMPEVPFYDGNSDFGGSES